MHRARGGRRSRGSGQRHPSHLKGKDIGMWYASRGRRANEKQEFHNRQEISMNYEQESNALFLLNEGRPANSNQRSTFNSKTFDRRSGTKREFLRSNATLKYNEDTISSGSDFWDDDASDYSAKPRLNQRPSRVPHTSLESLDIGLPSHPEHDRPTTSQTCHRPTEDKPTQRLDNKFISSSNPNAQQRADFFEIETEELEIYDDEDLMDSEDTSSEQHPLLNAANVRVYQADCNDFVLEFLENVAANKEAGFAERTDITQIKSHLYRQPDLDSTFKTQLVELLTSPKFVGMLEFRKKLPAYDMREKIVTTVNENQVCVISGETGCGKTTQVPQFILDSQIERNNGSLCRIVCTQPRRISAISVAERVADERCSPCGRGQGSVGFQIRLEKRLPRSVGSILFCTTGVLLRWLISDPGLSSVSHVVLDEIHERDVQTDFLMIILRELLPRRPDLKLILMSATLNAEQFSSYLFNCPMLHIPGYTFPVEEFYLEDVLEMLQYSPPQSHRRPRYPRFGRKKYEIIQQQKELDDWISESISGKFSPLVLESLRSFDLETIDLDLVVALIRHICSTNEAGAILVFLPGWEQIKKLHTQLTSGSGHFSNSMYRIIPLHSLMPTVNQREVFNRPPVGVRKIVIATSIAETSITIDDVVFVIDAGKIKLNNYSHELNVTTLLPEWVSRANAKQRKGRAGRVQSGKCYHLFTRLQESKLQDYTLPEMLRTSLEDLCLQVKVLRLGYIEPILSKAMQPPSAAALARSLQTLREIYALDEEENLTPLGYHLAKMPVEPRVGKMLLFAAMFSCLDPVLSIAAVLSYRDPFVYPLGKDNEVKSIKLQFANYTRSDHILLVNALMAWEENSRMGCQAAKEFCFSHFLSSSTLRLLVDMKRQFAEILHDLKFIPTSSPKDETANRHSDNEKLIRAVLVAGLYPQVLKVTPRKPGLPPLFALKNSSINLNDQSSQRCHGFRSTHPRKKFKRAELHLNSINSGLAGCDFPDSWAIFHKAQKSSSLFVHDISGVSPYPLLFFGGTISTCREGGRDCIVVDDFITFFAQPRMATIVKLYFVLQGLRREWDNLLFYKLTHPGFTQWDSTSRESRLMYSIVDLITTELTRTEHRIPDRPHDEYDTRVRSSTNDRSSYFFNESVSSY